MAFGSIQGQNGFLDKYGDTMLGELDMNGNKLTGLPTPITDSDAVPKSFLDGGNTGNANSLITYKKTINLSANLGTTTIIPKNTRIKGNGLIIKWNIETIVKVRNYQTVVLNYLLDLGANNFTSETSIVCYRFEDTSKTTASNISNSAFLPFFVAQGGEMIIGENETNYSQTPYFNPFTLNNIGTIAESAAKNIDFDVSNTTDGGYVLSNNITIRQCGFYPASNLITTVKGTMTFGIINFGNLL